jgi:hypothetical protein
MRTIFRRSLLISCLLSIIAHTGLASAETMLRVPFTFLVGRTFCSAGLYSVDRTLPRGEFVHLQGATSTCQVVANLGTGRSGSNGQSRRPPIQSNWK